MHYSSALTTLTLLVSTALAKPLLYHRAVDVSQPFFLVTTTSHHQNVSSSASLSHVLSLGLVEPAGSSNYYLVDEGPGEGSYPEFNLTDGNLLARINTASGVENIETIELGADSELAFSASSQPCGDLSLKHGYLLAVNGTADRWVLCTESSQNGLQYIVAGSPNSTCVSTYIQAVAEAPFTTPVASGPLRRSV